MPKVLDQAAIDRYHADGVYFPVQAMSRDEAGTLLARFTDLKERYGAKMARNNNQLHNSHMLITWLADLVRHPTIVDAVEDILGPDILCWNTQFFAKQPHDPRFVSWHQDSTYYGLSTNEVMTVWLALTPSVVENGCLRVVPGSHKTQVPHIDTFDENNFLTRGQEIAVKVDEDEVLNVELQPGQASLHNVRLFHGSEPNSADFPRVGFAIRYIPTHAYQTTGLPDSATLVRGKDTHGHFVLAPPPESDFHPDALARHAAAVDMQLQILYAGAAEAGKRATEAAR
jgi:non-haem Fe2+, alpha-ketoglutarate-dependent halogenase